MKRRSGMRIGRLLKCVVCAEVLLCCAVIDVSAQSEQMEVVSKDGNYVVGTLASMDGESSAVVQIADVETAMLAEEIQAVEFRFSASVSKTDTSMKEEETSANGRKELSRKYGDFVITDNSTELPETFTITVAGQEMKMVLMRGGVFNMGYDDWHSGRMKSEPVHEVELSSYYVSDDFVSTQVACELLHIDYKKAQKKLGSKFLGRWIDAKKLVEAITTEQGAPYRLVTEAEWEYAAISPLQISIFSNTQGYRWYIAGENVSAEWCHDYFGDYNMGRQINPTGPQMQHNNSHVARIYDSSSNAKWGRHEMSNKGKWCFVRLAISADQILTQTK